MTDGQQPDPTEDAQPPQPSGEQVVTPPAAPAGPVPGEGKALEFVNDLANQMYAVGKLGEAPLGYLSALGFALSAGIDQIDAGKIAAHPAERAMLLGARSVVQSVLAMEAQDAATGGLR